VHSASSAQHRPPAEHNHAAYARYHTHAQTI
jgi:hypothetical protein